MFAVGRQKCWTQFAYNVLYVGSSLVTCVLGKEGLGINRYYICAVNPKCSVYVRFDLFFSQKQFQLSPLILLCFHLLITSANQLGTWARYGAYVWTSMVSCLQE